MHNLLRFPTKTKKGQLLPLHSLLPAFAAASFFWMGLSGCAARREPLPPPPPPLPPVISGVSASSASTRGAITWTTDRPATSQVEWGTDTQYGNLTPLDTTPVTAHVVVLSGLQADTDYHFRVRSRIDDKESVSPDGVFRTLAPDSEFRAFWIDVFHPGLENPSSTAAMMSYMVGANVNAVIPEMRTRGYAYYNSALEPISPGVQPGYDPLADLLLRARSAGFEVHAWIVVFHLWSGSTPPPHSIPEHVLNLHPDWVSLTDTGSQQDSAGGIWLDPGHPLVQEFLTAVVADVVSRYTIDGLMLDYIRYASPRWGYNPVAVARFNREFGQSGIPAYNQQSWVDWRMRQVNELVRRMAATALEIRPALKLSAAVIASPTTARDTYLQDWPSWLEKNYLDFVGPMNYVDDAAEPARFEQQARDALFHHHRRHIYMGQGAYRNIITNSMRQIAAAQRLAFPGEIIFSYATPNSGTPDPLAFRNSLTYPASGPWAEPARVPPMTWKQNPSTGILKGFVQDAVTLVPIYNATVRVGEQVERTDANGFYALFGLAPGPASVRVEASGYLSTEQSTTITAGKVSSLHFALTR